jgi:hypothetical protein
LPHSDIHGSTPARGFPWLFAACHVLHRLLVPRHPPNALLSLEIATRLSAHHPPCTETILRIAIRRMILLIAEITLAQHTTVASEHRPIAERRKAFGQTLAPDLIRGMRWKRPETHQNLIYPDKDLPLGITRGTAPPNWRHLRHRCFILGFQGQNHQCRLLFASPRYLPGHLRSLHTTEVVEVIGLEPTTPCLQSRCSPS